MMERARRDRGQLGGDLAARARRRYNVGNPAAARLGHGGLARQARRDWGQSGVAMRFSVGLGLTNACNLSCAHCYRDVGPAQYLTLADVRRVCESLPVRA